jgi:hypothetical protein
MSMQQYGQFSFVLYGDGTSTSITLDITNFVRTSNILPNVPQSVVGYSVSGGIPSIASCSLAGMLMTITFSSAPLVGAFDAYVQFTF